MAHRLHDAQGAKKGATPRPYRSAGGRPPAQGTAVRVRVSEKAERALRGTWPEPTPLNYAVQGVLDNWVARASRAEGSGGR